jgi:hypothetical protein
VTGATLLKLQITRHEGSSASLLKAMDLEETPLDKEKEQHAGFS